MVPAVFSLPAISSTTPALQRNLGIGKVAHRIPENGVDNAGQKSLVRHSSLLCGSGSVVVPAEFKRRLIEEAEKERRLLTNYLETAFSKLWDERELTTAKKREIGKN